MLQPVTDAVQDRTVTDLKLRRTDRRAAVEAAARGSPGRSWSRGARIAGPHL